jgi:O-succinylbenzoic acid--CoA ligase
MSGFWVDGAAGGHPDRVAIEFEDLAITYAQLSQAAIVGARELDDRGASSGDPVALEMDDPLDFALALHACLLHASPTVPIDLRLSEGERSIRRRGAKTVLREWSPKGGSSLGWASTSFGMDGSVATIMHTSGTTSEPKRVELTYGNWMAGALSSAVSLGLDPEERWLCAMPLAHVGGLSILIRSVIYATTAVLHRSFDTEAVLAELMGRDRRITMVSLVPTMLDRLLDAGLERPPTLRWALVGGGPIAPSLLERAAAAGVPVAPTYGMTESCSQLFTFGHPLQGVDMMLAGAEREIWVRGPMVAPGAVDEHGWLHTGDLGRTDAEGRLEIVGRRSNTIITGGENVAPEEVEAVLLAHPDVADAAVVGRTDPQWGQAVVAKIVPRDAVSPDLDELRAFGRQRLAGFKVPKTFEIVESLPRTPSGKLLRREIR